MITVLLAWPSVQAIASMAAMSTRPCRRAQAVACWRIMGLPMELSARQKTCQRRGAGFICDVEGKCWCSDEPCRLPLPKPGESQYNDCLCRDCLRDFAGLPPRSD
jgi:hypothetical protein